MAGGKAKKARRRTAEEAQSQPKHIEVRKKREAAAREAAARRKAALDLYSQLGLFFGPASVRTALTGADEVHVNGRRLCQLMTLLQVKDWSNYLNRVAAGYCSKQFLGTLGRN